MKHFITYSHTEILETRISTDLDHNAETFTGKQCELLPAIIENRKQSGIFGTLRKTEFITEGPDCPGNNLMVLTY